MGWNRDFVDNINEEGLNEIVMDVTEGRQFLYDYPPTKPYVVEPQTNYQSQSKESKATYFDTTMGH
jgi:hypothetical protein